MFGIGWPELLLISIVALVAIGPKDMPKVMHQFGLFSRKMRGMFGDFQKHWDDLPNQVGLADMQKEAEDIQKKTYEQFGVAVDTLEEEDELDDKPAVIEKSENKDKSAP